MLAISLRELARRSGKDRARLACPFVMRDLSEHSSLRSVKIDSPHYSCDSFQIFVRFPKRPTLVNHLPIRRGYVAHPSIFGL
jgi:hypothetical protein